MIVAVAVVVVVDAGSDARLRAVENFHKASKAAARGRLSRQQLTVFS